MIVALALDAAFSILPTLQNKQQALAVDFYLETSRMRTSAVNVLILINASKLMHLPMMINELLSLNTKSAIYNNTPAYDHTLTYRNKTLLQAYDQKLIDSTGVIRPFLNIWVKYQLLNHFFIECDDQFTIYSTDTDYKSSNYTKWISSQQLSFDLRLSGIIIYILAIKNSTCEIQVSSEQQGLLSLLQLPEGFQSGFISHDTTLQLIPSGFQPNTIASILGVNETTASTFSQVHGYLDSKGCLVATPYSQQVGDQILINLVINVQNPYQVCENDILSQTIYFKVATQTILNKLAGVEDINQSMYFNFQIMSYILLALIFIYVYRVAVKISLSFEIPIEVMIRLINENNSLYQKKNYVIELISIDMYAQYFNSREITSTFRSIVLIIQSATFVSTIDPDEDGGAVSLQKLCEAKLFYKRLDNTFSVSICANNIAQIHLKNKRYLEALNEQEESILLAYKNLTDLKQLKVFHTQYDNKQSQFPNFVRRVKSYMLNTFIATQVLNQQGRNYASSITPRQHQTRLNNNNSAFNVMNSLSGREFPNPELQLVSARSISEQPQLSRKESDVNTYKMIKLQYQIYILFRRYQQTKMLFKFALKTQEIVIYETITSLERLIDESTIYREKTRSLLLLQIKTMTRLCYCYAKMKFTEKAKYWLARARNKLSQLSYNDDDLGDLFVHPFRKIPHEVLEDRLTSYSALIDLMENRQYEACCKLASLIENQKYRDQKMLGFCLKCLYQVFTEQALCKSGLIQVRSQQTDKIIEMVILIDYSQQMADEQITIAHSLAKYTIEQLQASDFVSLYLFNETMFQVFNRQSPATYSKILQKTLAKYLMPLGGKSSLVQTLDKAASLFLKVDNRIIERTQIRFSQYTIKDYFQEDEPELVHSYVSNMNCSPQENSPHFPQTSVDSNSSQSSGQENYSIFTMKCVCLFTEGAYCIDNGQLAQVAERYKQKNIQLVIFNIANSNWNSIFLQKLATQFDGELLNNEREARDYFKTIRPVGNNRKYYLEFL